MTEPRSMAVWDDLEFLRVMRAEVELLNISRDMVDRLCGFCDGGASKTLTVPPIYKPTLQTALELACGLGFEVRLVENPDARAKMKRRHDYQERDSRGRIPATHGVNAKALGVLHEMAVVNGQNGGRKRFAMMTAAEKRKHQRMAALAGWAKRRKLLRLRAELATSCA